LNSLEFPQGSLERNNLDPSEIARDELQAETGLVAQKMEYLGEIYIACGYANQKTYAFFATGLTNAEREPDHEEHDLAVRRVSMIELNSLIAGNQIKDAQTLAAWALYQTRLSTSGKRP
jgi:8-oxo-dGTP pyrophosphatase MutT (NUDIX family)